ncbi:MAG: hypothetical protein BAJALOKI1v1_520004 [Promethearchaeota archaeon]|nr:MAG: hypothetical protein BAJALOKI1v1_520004 [Candidatus Lokiarchaeota archaeon]
MNIFNTLNRMKKKEQYVLLYCLLDRIPIIVVGECPETVDEFIMDLLNLINFRKELVYFTDFTMKEELDNIFQNECYDFNSMRVQIRCPSNIGTKLIEQFDSFLAMIIGIQIPKRNHLHLIEKMVKEKEKCFLEIILNENHIKTKFIGIDEKEINLDLEEMIFRKITENAENSINKMKRVVHEQITKNEVNNGLLDSLLDFEIEKKEIKKNIFLKELQDFYSGAKRAFFILSKLNLLNNMQIDSKIGSKTLLETINYKDVPIERILSFILNEWGEDFSNIIENTKLAFIGDKIQSFWG